VGGKQFLFVPALFDHEFEVDVYVLAGLEVVVLLLLFLALRLLHLQATLFTVFLDLLYLVQMAALLLTSLHI